MGNNDGPHQGHHQYGQGHHQGSTPCCFHHMHNNHVVKLPQPAPQGSAVAAHDNNAAAVADVMDQEVAGTAVANVAVEHIANNSSLRRRRNPHGDFQYCNGPSTFITKL